MLLGCSSQPGPGAGTPAASGTPPGLEDDCRPTTAHIPFIAIVAQPAKLPAGMSLVRACWKSPALSELQSVTLIYENADKTKSIALAAANLPVTPRGRPTVALGGVTGYIDEIPRTDGKTLYGVEFTLSNRAYNVLALLGADNVVTKDEVQAVARSIATGAPATPAGP